MSTWHLLTLGFSNHKHVDAHAYRTLDTVVGQIVITGKHVDYSPLWKVQASELSSVSPLLPGTPLYLTVTVKRMVENNYVKQRILLGSPCGAYEYYLHKITSLQVFPTIGK